jgi:hypothetical protein
MYVVCEEVRREGATEHNKSLCEKHDYKEGYDSEIA